MRTISLILLMSMVIALPGSYYYLFRVKQQNIRKEIRQQILEGVPEEQIVLLKITSEEENDNTVFKWIKSDEFLYKGNMYDIIRFESYKGETWYYCILDYKETQLFARLDMLAKNEMQTRKERQQQKEKLQRLMVTIVPSGAGFPGNVSGPDMLLHQDYLFSAKTWNLSPPTPPPRNQYRSGCSSFYPECVDRQKVDESILFFFQVF